MIKSPTSLSDQFFLNFNRVGLMLLESTSHEFLTRVTKSFLRHLQFNRTFFPSRETEMCMHLRIAFLLLLVLSGLFIYRQLITESCNPAVSTETDQVTLKIFLRFRVEVYHKLCMLLLSGLDQKKVHYIHYLLEYD